MQAWIAAAALLVGGGAMAGAATVSATINGLRITIDKTSGAILRMEYPGPGVLLEADGGEAGLVDVAYPLAEFEPLRMNARCSTGAGVEKEGGGVTIRIASLGATRRGFAIGGQVSATVMLRPDTDGRSIILTCEIANETKRPIPQVVFPDLRGLVDVAGPDQTIFKTCGFGSAPFRELLLPEADAWYANSNTMVEHKSGGMFHSMWARWMDLGGLNGGFSLFPRRWGWDPQTTTVLQLRQATKRLRLMCLNPGSIAPGERWSSGEWVLTPHKSGWAKGIEPYSAWVRSHVKRRYEMPKHIREALGYRTVWMCQNQPADPTDAVWRFGDLPGLAREAHGHGLSEIVMWALQPAFDASLPAPFPHLGTEAELISAARACRAAGVELTPFISVLQANPKTAGRYGLKVTDNNGWTYHTEMIPRWNPPYASGLSCVQVGPSNQQWQDEVVAACARWADKGLASISWDQYWTAQATPTMQDLTKRLREYARKLNPESSFSGESLWNVEIDSEWLDYTWNWGGYADHQAFINAFPAPRPNANINRSEAEARFAFMDNLMLNVWPSKPDGINGSERIARVPGLSRTLKACARLRKRFLPYFTDGVLIGACLMPEAAPGVRLAAYVLPDRVMAVVLNQGADGPLTFRYDLTPWLAGAAKVTCTRTDESERTEKLPPAGASATLVTPELKHLEMCVYEWTRARQAAARSTASGNGTTHAIPMLRTPTGVARMLATRKPGGRAHAWDNVPAVVPLRGIRGKNEGRRTSVPSGALAVSGGFLLGGGANIRPGTPIENRAATTEEAGDFGKPSAQRALDAGRETRGRIGREVLLLLALLVSSVVLGAARRALLNQRWRFRRVRHRCFDDRGRLGRWHRSLAAVVLRGLAFQLSHRVRPPYLHYALCEHDCAE